MVAEKKERAEEIERCSFLLLHSQGALSSICFSRPELNRCRYRAVAAAASRKEKQARERERERRRSQGRSAFSRRRLSARPPSRSLSLFPLSFSPNNCARVPPPPRHLRHYRPFPFASAIENIVKLSEAEAEGQARWREVFEVEKALPRGKGQQGKRRKKKSVTIARLSPAAPALLSRARFARSLAKSSRGTERKASRGCARTRREEEVC